MVPATSVRLTTSKAFDEVICFTSRVPVGVPSLFHRSYPPLPAGAKKSNCPPLLRRLSTFEWVSLSIIVPAAVPSLFQSENVQEGLPAQATKKSVPFTFLNWPSAGG